MSFDPPPLPPRLNHCSIIYLMCALAEMLCSIEVNGKSVLLYKLAGRLTYPTNKLWCSPGHVGKWEVDKSKGVPDTHTHPTPIPAAKPLQYHLPNVCVTRMVCSIEVNGKSVLLYGVPLDTWESWEVGRSQIICFVCR